MPLALVEALAQGRIKAGDRVLVTAFGSGLTWGAALLQFLAAAALNSALFCYIRKSLEAAS